MFVEKLHHGQTERGQRSRSQHAETEGDTKGRREQPLETDTVIALEKGRQCREERCPDGLPDDADGCHHELAGVRDRGNRPLRDLAADPFFIPLIDGR